MDFTNASIDSIHARVKTKQISFVDMANYYLAKAKELNLKLNALITITEDFALQKAKEADEIISNKSEEAFIKYPLLGIPYVAKDLFLTKGIRTTAGSKVLENYIADYDATVVAKLNAAGAVLIGKANCDAWGHGVSGENSDFGPTKNPWNLQHVPGGSSSGSAAVVAAGMCVFSTGTDTGSSVRNPASYCNLVGIKPTYGRVSRYGITAFASSLDSMGHLTHTVKDCAAVLAVTEGRDQKDATSKNVDIPCWGVSGRTLGAYSQKKSLTIGLPKEYFGEGVDLEIVAAVRKAAKLLEKQGHKITEISLPMTEYGVATYYILAPSETSSNLARYTGIRYGNTRVAFGDEAKRRIMLGTYALSAGYYDAYYEKAQKVRTLVVDDFKKAFEKVDIILGPVNPSLPFKIGERVNDPLKMYLEDALTIPVNLAGLPGLALQAGFSKSGLPIGMQLIGPQWSEELLFRVGEEFQGITEYHKMVPYI